MKYAKACKEIAELEKHIVSIRRVCITDAATKAKEIAELEEKLTNYMDRDFEKNNTIAELEAELKKAGFYDVIIYLVLGRFNG